MESYFPLVAFLLLFLVVGVGFIFIHLMAGKFIRPNKPDAEKKTIYECGEPTIGSAWIQFDLRFYVVALLFVIFDVEVAFFFPWAEVFGKANAIAAMDRPTTDAEWQEYAEKMKGLVPPPPAFRENQEKVDTLNNLEELKKMSPQEFEATRTAAKDFAWLALMEIFVFFGVLLVGFAYLWKRGDLQWVRSTLAEEAPLPAVVEAPPEKRELVGSGS
jgi:NADH-quinone oxidoreductase subunit A